MNTIGTTVEPHPVLSTGNLHDTDYEAFLGRVQARLAASIDPACPVLFTTDCEDALWEAYISAFPAESRQHHNCHACRRFITQFGGLVTILPDGRQESVFWKEEDAEPDSAPAIAVLARIVRRARVTGVFQSPLATWGTPVTGVWRHLGIAEVPAVLRYSGKALLAHQRAAELKENFGMVMRCLADFSREQLDAVVRLLESDAIYRAEKVIGPAKWLRDLHMRVAAVSGREAKSNVVWRAVAGAPNGFCHIRGGVLGTLLTDIADGLPFEEVARRFAEKMHPLQYQRPTAPPAEGAIQAAEKLVATLGVERSLERRFARADELRAVWLPRPEKAPENTGGVFGHLRGGSKGASTPLELPKRTMTWAKFKTTVLPTADRIEVRAPLAGDFVAFTTAVHPDAPPILQWDDPECRNPVGWYLWHGGSLASQWGLHSGTFYPVEMAVEPPPKWSGRRSDHFREGVVLVIAGAKESKASGLALFPETLRSELHGIRAVIEAHSRKAPLQGLGEPHAAGLLLPNASTLLRVWSGAASQDYTIDRWD